MTLDTAPETKAVPRGKAKANGKAAAAPEPTIRTVVPIPLDMIDIGPNVRVNVEAIDELAASIAEHGVLQPIKVRAAGKRWIVVWGQRRVLAARKAGLKMIPALTSIEDLPADRLSIEQLVENLHRADLNPIDRAQALRTVIAAGVSQADLARKLGIAPSTIANDVGLLEAPPAIQELVEKGALTPSHAKAMKGLAPKTQAELAREVIDRGYSAHRTEDEVQERKRRADAIAEHNAQDAKNREANKKELKASIEERFKKVPKDALIVVVGQYYGDEAKAGHLAKLLQAAGYENARVAKSYGEIHARPSGGVCDCSAWKASEFERGSYDSGRYVRHVGVSIAKGCIDLKHEQAKEALAEKARRQKSALEEKVKQAVKRAAFGVAIPATSADTPPLVGIPRILAEAALFSVMDYRLPEWSVSHGGTRTNPWATIHGLSDEVLAKEFAMAIASDFRDHFGYHVDWPGLAVELGLEAAPA
jgi:ParB family chromosome partitioning protein